MVAFQELIVPLFSFILLVVLLHRWRSAAGKTLPPSPIKLPIIGNLHQLGKYPHRSLQSLSRRYGHLMLLHFGKKPVIVISSADAAHEIMIKQDSIFCNRPQLSMPDRLIYGSRDVAFSPHGEYWKKVRSICMLQLLSNKRVQSYRRVREEETSLMLEKIERLGRSSTVVNLSDELMTMTNDVICRVALGRKYGGEETRINGVLKEFVEMLGASPVGDIIPWLGWIDRVNGFDAKVKRVAKMIDEFLEDVVCEHKHNHGEKPAEMMDFVDILLQFQKENQSSSPLEDEAIKAIILDIFAGGADTSFSIMNWTMAELIKNPRVMKTLQDEVREVAGSKDKIDEEDIEKIPYLNAVFKESLRLHTPIPLLLPRESTRDTKVLGYDVVSGTHVVINAWAISRDPSLWKNPEEFYPERFLDTSIDYKGLHFELLPFGAGRRGCPGVAFTVSINELAIAKLVHTFNFALPNGGEEEDLDMSEANGITVHRKSPLLVVI